jgi:hypothetical protein
MKKHSGWSFRWVVIALVALGSGSTGADVKFSGSSFEGVLGDEQWVSDGDLETAGRAGRPNAAMLGAERAIACAGRYLGRFGFPGQCKRDIFAVTAAGDQHEILLNNNASEGKRYVCQS